VKADGTVMNSIMCGVLLRC